MSRFGLCDIFWIKTAISRHEYTSPLKMIEKEFTITYGSRRYWDIYSSSRWPEGLLNDLCPFGAARWDTSLPLKLEKGRLDLEKVLQVNETVENWLRRVQLGNNPVTALLSFSAFQQYSQGGPWRTKQIEYLEKALFVENPKTGRFLFQGGASFYHSNVTPFPSFPSHTEFN